MTRKEQIIEILRQNDASKIKALQEQTEQQRMITPMFGYYDIESEYKQISDAILALPLDVPSDEERRIWRIHDKTELIEMEVATSGELMERLHGRDEGMEWMRDEIIKRNK